MGPDIVKVNMSFFEPPPVVELVVKRVAELVVKAPDVPLAPCLAVNIELPMVCRKPLERIAVCYDRSGICESSAVTVS
jgi:hypothetical protein